MLWTGALDRSSPNFVLKEMPLSGSHFLCNNLVGDLSKSTQPLRTHLVQAIARKDPPIDQFAPNSFQPNFLFRSDCSDP